jgi:hypothetical protein
LVAHPFRQELVPPHPLAADIAGQRGNRSRCRGT